MPTTVEVCPPEGASSRRRADCPLPSAANRTVKVCARAASVLQSCDVREAFQEEQNLPADASSGNQFRFCQRHRWLRFGPPLQEQNQPRKSSIDGTRASQFRLWIPVCLVPGVTGLKCAHALKLANSEAGVARLPWSRTHIRDGRPDVICLHGGLPKMRVGRALADHSAHRSHLCS